MLMHACMAMLWHRCNCLLVEKHCCGQFNWHLLDFGMLATAIKVSKSQSTQQSIDSKIYRIVLENNYGRATLALQVLMLSF